jgi:DNA modification methylase
MNGYKIYEGDAPEVLRPLRSESVHCCVASPPYWGLRDYGVPEQIWDGDPRHDHIWGPKVMVKGTNHTDKRRWNHARNGRGEQQPREKQPRWERRKIGEGSFCTCGAWRGSLGLEPTHALYCQHLVAIFRETRRVLRKDGTLFLNLGDSYSSGNRRGYDVASPNKGQQGIIDSRPLQPVGVKPKDLLGIPWMVAFALRADGWYLRSDIIWAKPNAMPESVTDRPTNAHDYLFLLAKSAWYYYDAEAIKEPISPKTLTVHTTPRRGMGVESAGERVNLWMEQHGGRYYQPTRNKRSVWTIATEPYAGAHFATYPKALVEPCIKAGTGERGCCRECGAPWRRVVARTSVKPVDYCGKWSATEPQSNSRRLLANVHGRRQAGGHHASPFPAPKSVGWRPGCMHQGEPVACTVLDPFCGSGTTGVVALRLGRRFIGIDLNRNYVEMTRQRIAADAPLFHSEKHFISEERTCRNP